MPLFRQPDRIAAFAVGHGEPAAPRRKPRGVTDKELRGRRAENIGATGVAIITTHGAEVIALGAPVAISVPV